VIPDLADLRTDYGEVREEKSLENEELRDISNGTKACGVLGEDIVEQTMLSAEPGFLSAVNFQPIFHEMKSGSWQDRGRIESVA
jgi:hypothetical protein